MSPHGEVPQLSGGMIQNGSLLNSNILGLSAQSIGLGFPQQQGYVSSPAQYIQPPYQIKQSTTKTHRHHHHSRSSEKKMQQKLSQTQQYVSMQPCQGSLPRASTHLPILTQNVFFEK